MLNMNLAVAYVRTQATLEATQYSIPGSTDAFLVCNGKERKMYRFLGPTQSVRVPWQQQDVTTNTRALLCSLKCPRVKFPEILQAYILRKVLGFTTDKASQKLDWRLLSCFDQPCRAFLYQLLPQKKDAAFIVTTF